jgi:PEP-CTERM motif
MKLKVVTLLALATVAAASQASVFTYNFTRTLTGQQETTVSKVATLTISDTAVAGKIQFSLSANWDTATYGTGGFIDYLKFNVNGAGIKTGTYVSGNAISKFDLTNGAGIDAGKTFDSEVDFPAGKNDDRFLHGDTSTWTYTRAGLKASDISGDMMIHVQSFGNTSKFGTTAAPVPEPATMAVLGLGLPPFLRRRAKKS